MSNWFKYIIVTFIGLLCLFCWLQKCNSGPSEIEKYQDSLRIEKALNDTIKISRQHLKQQYDSSIIKNVDDSIKYTQKIDSLQRAYGSLKNRFFSTKDSIFNLKQQLDLFASGSDNERLKEIVNRLDGQLSDANTQLFYISLNRDSIDAAKNAEIERLNALVVNLKNQIQQFNNLLIQCTENASNMAKTAEGTINKAKKKNLLLKISGTLNAVLIAMIAIVK